MSLQALPAVSFGPAFLNQMWQQGALVSDLLRQQGRLESTQIAFDCDGVIQLVAIKDSINARRFYQFGGVRSRFSGSVTQYLMEIPGMAALVSGLAATGGHPILVSAMPLSRGVAVFNGFPALKTAFLGLHESVRVSSHALRQNPHTFFAEDLARGMMILHEIRLGRRRIEDYPETWREEIRRGIKAVGEKRHDGKLLKNPVIVALSKPNAPFPTLYVEDSTDIVQSLLDYSGVTRVIRPIPPWPSTTPFFREPLARLRSQFDAQALIVGAALATMVSPEGGERRLYKIPRHEIPPFREPVAPQAPSIVVYRDSRRRSQRDYYTHVIALGEMRATPPPTNHR